MADEGLERESLFVQPENCTYLHASDQSIVASGQRFYSSSVTRHLENVLLEVDDIPPISNTVKVYLRMKPFSPDAKLTTEQIEAYQIFSNDTLMTKLPNVENNYSNYKKIKPNDIVCKKYIFTKTFGPETSQLTIFEEAVKPHMIPFLKGQKNSVIMTYGTTNSGKSYTLRGTPSSPGIIPRGLEFVFSNITSTSNNEIRFKPINHSEIVLLDKKEASVEQAAKDSLLFSISDKSKHMASYKEMQKTMYEESSFNHYLESPDAEYSVWVSFAEIYNETIYDLLTNDCQNNRRTPLKLAADAKGRLFIKDLKMVHVSSGTEAFQIFNVGQDNLKIAATALNARSSRSHCIFTIKLLKYYPKSNANQVTVSTFTFCDLAGSERLNKTLNVGDRLKEAQNINTSLLVLSRCLKAIYDCQAVNQIAKKKSEIVAPFRESKLTRLFQRALCGKEHIALIVNINPTPTLYIETQHVLKFSAIAKRIVQDIKPVVKSKPLRTRFSQAIAQSRKTETNWDSITNTSDEDQKEDSESMYIDEQDYYDLINENTELKKELEDMRQQMIEKETEIRQELTKMYTGMMNTMEQNFKKQMKEQENSSEEYLRWQEVTLKQHFQEQLEALKCKIRRSCNLDDEDSNASEEKIALLETENEELKSKLESLKEQHRQHKEIIDQITKDRESKIIEMKKMENEIKKYKQLFDVQLGDKENSHLIELLKTQLQEEEERSKNLRCLLNDAKKEYMTLSENEKVMQKMISEKDLLLQENLNRISDLEEQLDIVTHCSAEQNLEIENLETMLEQQSKKIIKYENNIKVLENDLTTYTNALATTCTENSHLQMELENSLAQIELLKANKQDQSNNCNKCNVKKVDIASQTDEVDFSDFIMQTSCTENTDKNKEEIEELTTKIQNLTLEIQLNIQVINEKDLTIDKLKQELKCEHDSTVVKETLNKKMEQELKSILRELNDARTSLEHYKQEELEWSKKFDIYQSQTKLLISNKEEIIRENERLKIQVQSLERKVTQQQEDMETFMKNRDSALAKYENLVDKQRMEILQLEEVLKAEKENKIVQPKEVSMCNQHRNRTDCTEVSDDDFVSDKKTRSRKKIQRKDMVEVLSDDDNVQQKRVTRNTRGKRELVLTPQTTNDTNLIQFSSDSKATNKSMLAPPRSTRNRKKQLFHQDDDMVDFYKKGDTTMEHSLNATSSPSHVTRSMRKKRK